MEHFINALEFTLSIVAIASAFVAMRRGLTYSAMMATVVVLFFLALANLIRLVHLIWPPYLGWLEDNHVDHMVGILGYAAFIYLVTKSRVLKMPEGKPGV